MRRTEQHSTAMAYYAAGNVDVDVQLSVAIPVSALQLLSYYRFVSQQGAYSQNAWKDMKTKEQLRMLLADLKVDTAVPAHFQYLIHLRDRLAVNADPLDALGIVIKMRNVVTHPTRSRPADYDVYEWAETGTLARYWLCLALLNTVGYQGNIAAVLQEHPRWVGDLRAPPWAP